ncbi:MAG: transcription-repair coupling factor [Lachnospiraceae bacterium]|nr:transcription-repair coupling factor [Lachnospiraceae bacterium]
MKAWTAPLRETAGLDDLLWKLPKNKGLLCISGALDSQKAHLTDYLTEKCSAVLVVAENELKARAFYEDYRLYDPEVLLYPAKDLIFYEADLAGKTLLTQRIKGIKALLEQKRVTIVTSTGGCMDYLLPVRVFRENRIFLEMGGEVDLPVFAEKLVRLGYERTGQVEAPGQFSIRGDILDIFDLTEENPWRIELFGDEIDSIRCFDAESQRSIENLQEICIYPATEEIGKEEKGYGKRLTDTLLDYLPESYTVVLDEPGRIRENADALSLEFHEYMARRLEKGQVKAENSVRMLTAEGLLYELNRRNCIGLSLLEPAKKDWEINGVYPIQVKTMNSYNGQFLTLVEDLKKWKRKGYRTVLLSPSRTRGQRLARELQEEELNAYYLEDAQRELSPGEILVAHGYAANGFEYPMQKFVMITESDIFGKEKKKKKKKKFQSTGDRIRSFSELSVGDYVVHENHGLGIYRGIEKVTVDRTVKDYIKIEYSGGSNLYIQATGLEVLQKYAGSDAAKAPRLNKLGGQEWNKTKTRVRGAVKNIAGELVKLYALRQKDTGYQYGPDTVWQREFEELFPFEETEDQLSAIAAAKADMESPRIMDRLICGDVGYGKTEIAIRTAFKAVQENKQVVVLAPTTILAQQHYNTFIQRMKDFPVRVDLLCRFRTAKQQKQTLEDLKKGLVDVLIGTHRVLSKDVEFRDLGLLVVDEEQRFGVVHKEKIKQLKTNVDVLTLTATPIPRTMHMSLIGIRDMSVLEEAPMERMPIQTYVMEYDEELVREAITRELARDGQVFYVYNRVQSIVEQANRIQELVPDASVGFAHGQMSERELEKIMYSFINGEMDVLVSTTIIETGMDISNANTIIIHEADRLGLSQLYQLRGRVGRSNRNAYAFLMYQKNRQLKEVAEKRLHAIREYTELGSGAKIAMRDLEIRGAGNLLGAEQHGHMEAVGYDLYCKMLGEAVSEAKGEELPEQFETLVDLNMDAYIPPSYISNENQKLDIYKRIACLETREEADDMLEELIDRFGEPPKSVQNLLKIADVKADAHKAYVTEIKQLQDSYKLTLFERAMIDVNGIDGLIRQYNGQLVFKMEKNSYFLYKPRVVRGKKETQLDKIRELLENLQALVLDP